MSVYQKDHEEGYFSNDASLTNEKRSDSFGRELIEDDSDYGGGGGGGGGSSSASDPETIYIFGYLWLTGLILIGIQLSLPLLTNRLIFNVINFTTLGVLIFFIVTKKLHVKLALFPINFALLFMSLSTLNFFGFSFISYCLLYILLLIMRSATLKITNRKYYTFGLLLTTTAFFLHLTIPYLYRFISFVSSNIFGIVGVYTIIFLGYILCITVSIIIFRYLTKEDKEEKEDELAKAAAIREENEKYEASLYAGLTIPKRKTWIQGLLDK